MHNQPFQAIAVERSERVRTVLPAIAEHCLSPQGDSHLFSRRILKTSMQFPAKKMNVPSSVYYRRFANATRNREKDKDACDKSLKNEIGDSSRKRAPQSPCQAGA
jgi:hypothetical protein